MQNNEGITGFFAGFMSAKVVFTLFTILLVAAACVIIHFVRKKLIKHISETGQLITVVKVIIGIIRFVVILIGCIIILQLNGINISGLVVSLGVASAIVGLAFQDFIKDIIMGIRILVDGFFAIGDVVEYQGHESEVIEFNMRVTKTRDLVDNSITSISNRNIYEVRKVGDIITVDIPLSYKENVEKIHALMENLCSIMKQDPLINEAYYRGTQGFEDSAILYRLQISCNPTNRPAARRVLIKVVQEGLLKADIHIPYNQLDIHWDTTSK